MSEPSSNEFNTDSVGTDPISTKSVVQTNNTKPLTVAGLASVE